MPKVKKTILKEIPEIRTTDRDTGEIIVTPARLALVDEMIEEKNDYKPFFKTPFNHDTDETALKSGTLNLEPSKTQANQAPDTEINGIMRRYGITGPEQLAPPPPSFMEMPEDWSMETVLRLHEQAADAFNQLPADIRYRFNNDLARYVGEVDALRSAGAWESLKALGIDVVGLEPPPKPLQDPPADKKQEPPKKD